MKQLEDIEDKSIFVDMEKFLESMDEEFCKILGLLDENDDTIEYECK